MSKRFFKPSIGPELLHRISRSSNRSIEIWTTTCIVTNFGKSRVHATLLINPGNPQLSGVRNFPYFPRGGPVPKEKPMSMHKDWQPLGYVSQWGGMEVGTGMLYPVSVVDGLVHQQGGWRLELECRMQKIMAMNGDVCPVGSAVKTSAGCKLLKDEYDEIVHTTPPFYKFHENPHEYLSLCYERALKKAFESHLRVATPLLGAGARGFPESEAIAVAAQMTNEWCTKDSTDSQCIIFGLLEPRQARELIDQLEKG